MRLTFILSISFVLAGTGLAQSARDDEPDIQRDKLKFRLGGPQNNNQPFKNSETAVPVIVANPLNFPYVPLPRYKPGTPSYRPPTRVAAPLQLVEADQRGQVSIVLDRMARERDQTTARELRPTLKTSWSAVQIATAAKRCDLVLATTNIDAKRLDPIGGAGGCGIAAPVLVSSFGAVKVNPPAKLNCNLALATYKWLTDKAQPIARDKYKSAIVAIQQYSSYTCRSRRGAGTSRISEHAFGNALDVASFTLASGKKISIGKDWSTAGLIFGLDTDATFLNDVHKGACDSFATVLGPRYNKAHANHFHMDMGRGGRYKICK